MRKIDAEQFALLAEPSGADPEQHASARIYVQSCDLFGERNRLVLGNEGDPRREFQIFGHRSRHAERDDLIAHLMIDGWNLSAGGKLSLGIYRERRMLRHPERFKTKRFRNSRELRRMRILASERSKQSNFHKFVS